MPTDLHGCFFGFQSRQAVKRLGLMAKAVLPVASQSGIGGGYGF
jgi:hypothetical protein